MPRMDTQVLGNFKTGMDRSSKRGGKDGAQRLWTLQNAYINERGEAIPRPGLQHVADVANSAGLYGWQGQLHVFHGEDDFVDPGNPLVQGHWIRYPLDLIGLDGSFADGQVGATYSSDLGIYGGSGYTNPRVTAGTLPAGLALSVVGDAVLRLSGRPTTAGATSFTVAVDDHLGRTASSLQTPTMVAANVATWDPAKTSQYLLLSNANFTATYQDRGGTTGGISTNGTLGRDAATANHYFEITFDLITSNKVESNAGIALAGSQAAQGTYAPGTTADSYGVRGYDGLKMHTNVGVAYGSAFFSGDTIGVLLKNGKLYFRFRGTWVGDPVAETGAAFTGLTGTYYPSGSGTYPTDAFTGRFSELDLIGTLPTGSKAWATD